MNRGAIALREWLNRSNIKQAQFAEMLGWSEPFTSMILSGDRLPGRDGSVKIEDIAGIPPRLWTLSAHDELAATSPGKAAKRRHNQK